MDQFALDAGLVFWTVVTFLCLVGLLARFVFRPFKALLDQRETRVRAALDDADKARAEAAALLGRNQEQIAEAREEARRIVSAGHQIVAEMRREARDSARQEAEAIAGRARAEVEREARRSLDELKLTVANLAVRISREVLTEELDPGKHEKLADEFIERLKTARASREVRDR